MTSLRSFRLALFPMALAFLFVPADAQRRVRPNDNIGRPVLWERVNIRRQDLFNGPAGMMPDLRRINFVREETGGYSKKYRITDGSGRTWVAKLGKEAQSETAAVRLIAALGYKTEIVYLVPRLTIPGRGTFTNVRLEARPDWVDRGKEWRWSDNPFRGTDQLQALKILMAMINNWDMKNANNVILNARGERHYVISDLGATFGKMGAGSFPLFRWIGRTRNVPQDYSRSKFITGVSRGRVKFSFNGKNNAELGNITVGQARWLADLLIQLTDNQIRDAFRAANYLPGDVNLMASAFKDRIYQLDRAAVYGTAGIR
ncbi:MAG: hypothetical protein ABR530_07940 [Pyrinomonadaceae bacterium]